MRLMNKFKIGLTTLLVGSTLVLSGCSCSKTVEGTVTKEYTGTYSLGRDPFRVYHIRNNNDKEYVGVIRGTIDPFNVGDCAKVELGKSALYDDKSRYENGKYIEDGEYFGRAIVKFEHCKK